MIEYKIIICKQVCLYFDNNEIVINGNLKIRVSEYGLDVKCFDKLGNAVYGIFYKKSGIVSWNYN